MKAINRISNCDIKDFILQNFEIQLSKRMI